MGWRESSWLILMSTWGCCERACADSCVTFALPPLLRHTLYSVRIAATNDVGQSDFGPVMGNVDALIGNPSAPTITAATFDQNWGDAGATLLFTEPTDDGGRDIAQYMVKIYEVTDASGWAAGDDLGSCTTGTVNTVSSLLATTDSTNGTTAIQKVAFSGLDLGVTYVALGEAWRACVGTANGSCCVVADTDSPCQLRMSTDPPNMAAPADAALSCWQLVYPHSRPSRHLL